MGHLTIGRTMPLTFKVLRQNVKVIDCSECSLSGYLSLLLKPGFGEFLTFFFFFFYKNAQAVVSSIGPMGYIFGSCVLGLLSFVITPVCACTCTRTTETPQLCNSLLARCAHVFHRTDNVCRVRVYLNCQLTALVSFPWFIPFGDSDQKWPSIRQRHWRKKLQPCFCKQGESSCFKIIQGAGKALTFLEQTNKSSVHTQGRCVYMRMLNMVI